MLLGVPQINGDQDAASNHRDPCHFDKVKFVFADHLRSKPPHKRERLQSMAYISLTSHGDAMPDKPIELSIEVPAETRRAIEGAAAELGMTTSAYLEYALRKSLVDAGYLDEEAAHS